MLFRKNRSLKPSILVTHSHGQPFIQLLCIRLAVWLAGGEIRLVSPMTENLPVHFDALILYGGVDIFPRQYKKEARINYNYDTARDEMESRYLKIADQKNVPVLGICRGAQLLNIYHGGNLHVDITKAYEKAIYPSTLLGYVFFRKQIKIREDSLLRTIIGKPTIKVNSLHRQSIDVLGKGLVQTSCEYNGVIQSIEKKEKNFYMGVQFHPEFLLYKKRFRNIFKVFVKSS